MSALVRIFVHPSQFPEHVARDLAQSLESRALNHKFLYDGQRQTQKWLALHQSCSPSQLDPECSAMYDRVFQATIKDLTAEVVHLIGLGAGGGQKDTRLADFLMKSGKEVYYSPCDVSTAMVLVAHQEALTVIEPEKCSPVVCDLGTAERLEEAFSVIGPRPEKRAARLVTFFGMLPNFEPELILPRLAGLVRPGDLLLLNANLAPQSGHDVGSGKDETVRLRPAQQTEDAAQYDAGLRKVLPQYDNEPTREWLMSCLKGLGVLDSDGGIEFTTESNSQSPGLKRIAAYFHFAATREIALGNQTFVFSKGTALRLFFSYRFTPEKVMAWLERHGLQAVQAGIAASGEEAVFQAVKS